MPDFHTKFEAVMGIHIVSVLASNHSKLTTSARVKLQQRYYEWGAKISLPDPKTDPVQYVEEVIIQWSLEYSDILPTWAHLLEVLQDIGL